MVNLSWVIWVKIFDYLSLIDVYNVVEAFPRLKTICAHAHSLNAVNYEDSSYGSWILEIFPHLSKLALTNDQLLRYIVFSSPSLSHLHYRYDWKAANYIRANIQGIFHHLRYLPLTTLILDISYLDTNDLPYLQLCPQLQTLQLSVWSDVDLRFIATMTNLESLSLSTNRWENVDLDLTALTKLQSLFLINTKIQSIQWLPRLTALTALTLDNVNTNIDLSLINQLSQLQHLTLYELSGHINFEHLQLKSLDIKNHDGVISGCHNSLQQLAINNSCFDGYPSTLTSLKVVHETVLEPLPVLPDLIELRLHHMSIFSDLLINSDNLQVLDLECSDTHQYVYDNLPHLPQLRIVITGQWVTDCHWLTRYRSLEECKLFIERLSTGELKALEPKALSPDLHIHTHSRSTLPADKAFISKDFSLSQALHTLPRILKVELVIDVLEYNR